MANMNESLSEATTLSGVSDQTVRRL